MAYIDQFFQNAKIGAPLDVSQEDATHRFLDQCFISTSYIASNLALIVVSVESECWQTLHWKGPMS